MHDLAGKTVGLVARHADALPTWLAETTASLSPPPRIVAVAVASREHDLLQFVNAVIAALERTGRLADMRERAGLSGP